jgi:hypothetical protein
MNDLYMTHLLHQRIDDLRRTGEARSAVRRALRERWEAAPRRRGMRLLVVAANGLRAANRGRPANRAGAPTGAASAAAGQASPSCSAACG